MEKLKIALEEQSKIKERLSEILKVELCNTEPQNVDYENSGEVTDMLKDLAETEKNCWEAQYYKMMCEAMKKEEQSGNNDFMGYNRNRYRNGEYAPSGHGNSTMGFQPEMRIPPEMRHMIENDRFGYNGNGNQGGSSSNSGENSNSSGRSSNGRSGYPMSENWDPQYGEPYNRYKDALRHYHETGQKEDMDEMDAHAAEHVKSAIKSFREIYKSASPTTQKKLKEDLTKLVGEM